MTKVIMWLTKVTVTAIITSVISAVTVIYVMNVYMQELLGPVASVIPTKEIELSEFVEKLWTPLNIVGQGGTTQAGKETASKSESKDAANPPQEDEAVAVWSQTGTEESRNKEKVVLSADQFLTMRDKLTNEDKLTVFSVLSSRLPQEEFQRISTKLENGLTAAELEEIEKIVSQYLKPEQYAELMKIVEKYEAP